MYKRPIAYICSPSKGKMTANTKKACEYSRTVYTHGYTPIAPHLLFPQFMDDSIADERNETSLMNRVLIRKARIMFVCGDEITSNMQQEMLYARQIGLTVVPLDGIVRIEEYLKKGEYDGI
jgi:hypothetical protein